MDHLLARGEDPRRRLPPVPPPDPAPPEGECSVTSATIPRTHLADEEAERACQEEGRCTTCAPVLDGYLCEDRADRLRLTFQAALGAEDRLQPAAAATAEDWPPATAVHRVDLDGDGSAEVVVVRYEGTSNGIALAYSRVVVLDLRRGTRARLWANGLRLVATQDRGCTLLVRDFGYDRDLESGGTHAYWLEYPLSWAEAGLEPQPGAWYQRWHPEDTRTFRRRTPRTRPEPAELESLGTIIGAQEDEWAVLLAVQAEDAAEPPAEVVLYDSSLLGIGAEVAAQPASSTRAWAGLVGQRLLEAPGGIYWVGSGQGSSTSL